MLRLMSWCSPVVCLIALAVFASHAARADDAATSQPSAAAGSIVVTVVDSDSNPVVKARVQLYPQKKASDSDDAGAPAKPKAIAKAYTGDDGKFTFENVAPGDYKVNASFKKTGSKGSAKVSVTTDALNPAITITFSAPSTDSGGGATTAPSTAPAQ
jgi:hypothetical protein